MERCYVVNMAERNKCSTLMGPPCGMMDGGKIRPSLQYRWRGWLVNMPIHTRFDSCGGTQIEVTLGNGPKIDREGSSRIGRFFTRDIFA